MINAAISTAEQRVDMERHRAVREAMAWVRSKDSYGEDAIGSAVAGLLDSVHRQARWSPHGTGYEPRVRHSYRWTRRPVARRTCFDCNHYTENYCRLFAEQIDSEVYAARDCDGFEAS